MAISAAAIAAGSARAASAVAPYVLPCGVSYLLGNRSPRTGSSSSYAPSYTPQFSPTLNPQFTPENVADQRNAPHFQQELHLYFGANEMVRMTQDAPAIVGGTRLYAKAVSSSESPQERKYSVGAGGARWLSPTKVVCLASLAGGIWALCKVRSVVQQAHHIQLKGWCRWKSPELSTEQLTLAPASEIVPVLLEGTHHKILLEELNQEIDTLQSSLTWASRVSSIHLGFLWGVTDQSVARCQESLARTRVLKQKLVDWLLQHPIS